MAACALSLDCRGDEPFAHRFCNTVSKIALSVPSLHPDLLLGTLQLTCGVCA